MKAGVFAVAAAVATGVSAGEHHAHRRHAHKEFHLERGLSSTGSEPTCGTGCTTIYEIVTGEMTLHHPTTTSPAKAIATSPAPNAPVPFVTTYATPGVYTIPASTITLTGPTEVPAPTSTVLPSPGTWSAGGVTTTVTVETTVTVPYATTGTSEGTVTSTILTTTYVCPSAGTYTIAPLTTTCTESTVWVYPTPASYPAGTYTHSDITTTITETDYVVFCPYATSAPVNVVGAIESVASAVIAPIASVVSSAVAEATSVIGELGNSGQQWGITYTPYTSTGDCKAASDVATDIASIANAGFSVVRVYSTDCSALANIGSACAANGLKIILGVFISSTGISGAAQQVTDIHTWGQWDLVELIIIGNEALLSGFCSASELAGFISSSASTFQASGYTGPVSTTEPLSTWQEYSETLCPVVDIVCANIHAFFNSETTADQAGPFVKQELDIAGSLCPGKYALNVESGWPSAGTANGLAVPGPAEQAAAIASVKEYVGGHTVMFSFANDLWKEPGAFDCEQSFGAFHLYQ